ncbi:TonB-dependent receptor [Thermomonas sp. XSG]|uniref:TonB-dependent receptor plug domain-containing protein n=1 Tax=Thermomonas sp. XSG TaxID=2771436 RepID=UPI0016819CCB|nr:TonB-dependent receptor [Thermomonas sp. XSG]QNU15608.1 TonB-dependent receptor [Thermomonas sp. XSG]
MPRITPLALALSSLLAATPALAQQADKEARTLDTLIVTGTRVADRTVAESQSPIDILTPETLEATGTTELATALARALPSLNFPRPGMADGTSGVRPAQLRGLSPDQVLILVNGKRRHISALVNVNGTIGRGSSAVDLNTIPVAAIERVEVLRDGASAQYGSDAIGGVVNIVLKGSGDGGSIALGGGQYSEGDGKQWQLSGDTGLTLSGDAGTIHVAAQAGHQDMTNRAGPYQGSAPNTGNFPNVGQTAFKLGDPDVDQSALSLNANLKIGENNLYLSAMSSARDITSFAFYRSKNHSGQGALLAQVYPNGYVPEINQDARDRSVVVGLKGVSASGWNWDLSYNLGDSRLDFRTQNTINYALGATSPRSFYDGALQYTQQVVNADFSKAVNIGLEYPATFSVGAEHRQETWEQTAGEADSYFGSGAQGFGGFTPRNAGNYERHNYAVYAGLEGDFTEKFSAGLAGRYEDYSDFGDQFSGKLSARYAFTETAALRGTVATGFRAPSLAQQHYQAVTTNITSGVAYETGTFPAAGAAAQALGADPLQAETSLSYSLGLVLQPAERIYLTIDAYRIEIDDRIVLSSNLNIANNAAAQALLAGLGITNVTSARYFNNAIDTRTRGVDVVGTWNVPLEASSLNLTASYNYNKTDVTRIAPNPAALSALGANLERMGRDERGRIEEGSPRDKFALTAGWNLQRWDFNAGATRYGEVTARHATNPAQDQTYGGKWTLDLSVNFRPNQHWVATLGADNALDEYPDRNTYANSTFGMFPYSLYSPFGFNGRYVYGKVAFKW